MFTLWHMPNHIYMDPNWIQETVAKVYYYNLHLGYQPILNKKDYQLNQPSQETPMDMITDINGNVKLENQHRECEIVGNMTFIDIPYLGFHGLASHLLREHGLMYLVNGVNALDIETLRNIPLEDAKTFFGVNEDDFDDEVPSKEIGIDALNCPVSHLEMSVRTNNRIEAKGIETIGQLTDRTEKELANQVGYTALAEVRESLGNIGLRLTLAPPF